VTLLQASSRKRGAPVTTEEKQLLEHARQNNGTLRVPLSLIEEPAILSLRKAGFLAADWHNSTDDIIVFRVVGWKPPADAG
jgi:hypothetical protein